MMRMNRHEEIILNSLRRIKKGECPNFFVLGKSFSSLERLGIMIVKKLEEQQVIEYMGNCKYFTIKIPYFDSENDGREFMNRLRDSISIARDCYDRYEGFILLEFAADWSKEGKNEILNIFWKFVRENQDIRFVLLLAELDENTDVAGFFSEFVKCGRCLKIALQLETTHQNVSYFCSIANHKGYVVSEEAKQYLYKTEKEREKYMVDNTYELLQLLDQIVFDKEFERSKNKVIEIDDIRKCVPEKQVVIKQKIGFYR